MKLKKNKYPIKFLLVLTLFLLLEQETNTPWKLKHEARTR